MSTQIRSDQAIESLAAAARERGQELTIMKVAKLLYLADLRAVRQTGRAMSGVRWVWGNYGPWNNSIYGAIDYAVQRGTVTRDHIDNDFGPVQPVAAQESARMEAAGAFLEHIEAVLDAYGSMAPAELRDLTYQTSPMLKVQEAGIREVPLDLAQRPVGSLIEAALAVGGTDLYFDDEPDDLPRWKEDPGGPLISAGRPLHRHR